MQIREGTRYLNADGYVVGPMHRLVNARYPEGTWAIGSSPTSKGGWDDRGRRGDIRNGEDLLVPVNDVGEPIIPKDPKKYDEFDSRLDVALKLRHAHQFIRPENRTQYTPRPLPWTYDKETFSIIDARGNTVATNTGNKDGPFIVRLANATQKGPTP